MPKNTTATTPQKVKPKGGRKKADDIETIAMPDAQPTPEPAQATGPANPHNLPVVYDELGINEYSSTSKLGPMTPADMRALLDWETEKEYQKRMVDIDPSSKPEHWIFGETFHCKNTKGEKVRCNANANNRPFDMLWCESLVHTILYGQWAGPLTVPGETVNGETIRVSRYGRVLSGQHQGTALILADEFLQASRAEARNAMYPKYPFWNGHKHPVIETIVVTGLSEDERILRSIDYVKPRTVADMLYTMEVFRANTSTERKEMTKILATAIDTLWTRTDTKGYRTHPEIVGFLDRHKRLLKCVEHLFVQNNAANERRISKLRLSPGQGAALMYIMGSSGPKTEGDDYRNETPPSEKNLDWSYYDRAAQFWSMIGNDRTFLPVRTALAQLVDSTPHNEDNQGLGGRGPEKLAILSKAWEVYKDHPDSSGVPFNMDDLAEGGALRLAYSTLDDKGNTLPNGMVALIDDADFLGIDCPESLGKSKPARPSTAPPMPAMQLSQEDIDRATEEARKRREEQRKKLLEARKK